MGSAPICSLIWSARSNQCGVTNSTDSAGGAGRRHRRFLRESHGLRGRSQVRDTEMDFVHGLILFCSWFVKNDSSRVVFRSSSHSYLSCATATTVWLALAHVRHNHICLLNSSLAIWRLVRSNSLACHFLYSGSIFQLSSPIHRK